jgi:hypothetical protein
MDLKLFHMKKILLMSFFTLLFMQACKKDQELIDNKKPEERVAQAIDKYNKELVNSAEGWVATIKTTVIDGTYSFYMNFNESSRVAMWADYAPNAFESTYRLKYVMAPSIIFDTYSTLHLLQDPNPASFEGEYGQGYGSDFEFEIREQVGDTIKLVGKKRLAELTLVKANAADKDFYTNAVSNLNTYTEDHPYLYISDPKDNANKIQVSVNTDPQGRTLTLTSLQNNAVSSESSKFVYSAKDGLKLSSPLSYNGLIIVAVNWDNTNNKFFLVTSSGSKIEVLMSGVPIMPLHLVLGTNYVNIVVPKATTYGGWSSNFITRRATAATAVGRFSLGGVPLVLDRIAFVFNSTTKTVNLVVITTYGTNTLQLPYPYTYTKTSSGVYKFTALPASGNSAALQAALDALLKERINVDTFTIDYFADAITGQILGQFKSIEHPDFTFSGFLQ